MKASAVGIFVSLLALLATSAKAQEFSVYLSSSFDQPSGSAYAYAETTADYSTGYYYYVCTAILAAGQEDGYDPTQWDSYESSASLTCDTTDAQVSWSFSVPTNTIYMEFYGQHYEYIDYLTYQFDPYCYDTCYEYWDAYELSLLSTGGNYGGGAAIYLPGPPAVSTVEEQFFEQTQQQQGTWCPYPYYETSVYSGASDPDVEMGYYGLFYAWFTPGSPADFTGRYVQEDIGLTYQNCSIYGNVFDPITNANFDDSGYWISDSDTYGQNGDIDEIGVSKEWGDYFQALLGGGSCVAFSGTQVMSMNSCRNPLVYYQYDSGHNISFTLYPGSMTAIRASASGAGQ